MKKTITVLTLLFTVVLCLLVPATGLHAQDLVVTDIDFTNISCAGDNISGTVDVTVLNQGAGSATGFQVSLSSVCGATFGNVTVGADLGTGQSATATLTLAGSWNSCSTCTCDFTATVDATNVIGEDNEGNNTLVETYTSTLPNLRVVSVTPSFNCAADGSLTGNVAVTLDNNGCGNAVNVPVQLTSTGSYTFTNQTVSLGPGASTVRNFAFTPTAANCGVNFTATIDPANTFCECSGSDNDMSYYNFTPNIPDLSITDIDFTTVGCGGDGISGNVRVQVANTGCAAATNFQVALTTDGCLSFSPQTVASLGVSSSTWLTFTISGNWADCTSRDCDFTATVDAPDTVCEFDGTNNSHTETYSSSLPDLVVTDIDFTNVSCAGDNISGTIDVTVQNQGYGSATGFQVSLSSVCGATFGNATVDAVLGNGQSATVTLTVAGSWSNCSICTCDFTATVDATNVICECSGSNNTRVETYTSTLPNLQVVSVIPSSSNCAADGSLTGNVAVTVENNGCGGAVNVPVQLTTTGSYTFTNQTVSLAPGANRVLNFAFTPTAANSDVDFTATIDPSNTFCECSGSDNATTYSHYVQDLDGDGMFNTCEQGPDGDNANYDGNNDSTPDCQQSNVVSFHTADGNNYVTLAAPNGTQLSGVQALPAPAPGTFSDQLSFPYGLLRFTINGVTPGGAAQVRLILSGGASIDSYWRYGKEPGNATVHPYEFMLTEGTGAEILGNTVTLHFIDGQRGDDDLNSGNGVIVDDGGPASTTPAIPAHSKGGMLVFMILLSLFAWWMIRARKLSV